MEDTGKGDRKEAALRETLVSPLYKPPQPECLPSVALPPTLCAHSVGDKATLFRASLICS